MHFVYFAALREIPFKRREHKVFRKEYAKFYSEHIHIAILNM